MERLRHLIKEVLSTPPKKDSCNCGCHTCENVGNTGVVLNESLVKKDILSENLRYHVDNKLPLTENTFRYGSRSFLNLWSEARYLYLREIIHVNDDDKEILLETNLGEYGMYEGKKVPLDLPMLEEDEEKRLDGRGWPVKFSGEDGNIKANPSITDPSPRWDMIRRITGIGKTEEEAFNDLQQKWEEYKKTGISETEKEKTPPIGKPKRGGSKKFYVYVRDKGKVKKVSFGQVGMSAKINDPKARRAFAARHDCANKKDRTKPSYWSCRLPRYAKLLGLKSSFSGYW
jgi:hypothetical protein